MTQNDNLSVQKMERERDDSMGGERRQYGERNDGMERETMVWREKRWYGEGEGEATVWRERGDGMEREATVWRER